MCLDLVRDWDEFGGFLAQFPNTKSLKLLFTSCLTKRRLSRYLDNITACLHVLSLLRKLEIRVANQGPKAGALLKFKQECPSLEQFVDHEERGWVYIPSSDDGGGGFDARLEYQLVRRILRHDDDLPPPEWICSA
ncbi:hypothetical protein M407DRAFT_246199 [Tulasnella calospora MUT 4182]|uniref:FBD domain-containing protein n=1 Tax=Tulasnella calospora MUT 4182 TaxID=1051891 RepID=A0A0C3LD04_9AGAM|nr:hypothetical protein M407DRAFT_246199 [Tulasnella calospora MUT 4182]